MSDRPVKGPNGRFQQVCPRRLEGLPDSPCPLALERIHAITSQKDKKAKDVDNLPGCPWYCTSAESNFCFFSQVDTDTGPYSDEDIAAHLSLTTAQVAKTYESGISKWRANKDSPDMQDLKETLIELTSRGGDNTVYLPDNFLVKNPTFGQAPEEDPHADADVPPDASPKKPRKRNHLYGLYSQQTLERIKKEREHAPKGKAAKAPKKK